MLPAGRGLQPTITVLANLKRTRHFAAFAALLWRAAELAHDHKDVGGRAKQEARAESCAESFRVSLGTFFSFDVSRQLQSTQAAPGGRWVQLYRPSKLFNTGITEVKAHSQSRGFLAFQKLVLSQCR
jgi:hypothetical protein